MTIYVFGSSYHLYQLMQKITKHYIATTAKLRIMKRMNDTKNSSTAYVAMYTLIT